VTRAMCRHGLECLDAADPRDAPLGCCTFVHQVMHGCCLQLLASRKCVKQARPSVMSAVQGSPSAGWQLQLIQLCWQSLLLTLLVWLHVLLPHLLWLLQLLPQLLRPLLCSSCTEGDSPHSAWRV
jgi:hypothetical protein